MRAVDRLGPARLDALLQVLDLAAQPAAQERDAAIGRGEMLALMARDRPLAAPRLPVAGRVLALVVGPVAALAIEVGLAEPDVLRLAEMLRIVAIVVMTPRDHHRVGIVDRHDPAREAGTAEIAHAADILED